jgi:hypothetical protein
MARGFVCIADVWARARASHRRTVRASVVSRRGSATQPRIRRPGCGSKSIAPLAFAFVALASSSRSTTRFSTTPANIFPPTKAAGHPNIVRRSMPDAGSRRSNASTSAGGGFRNRRWRVAMVDRFTSARCPKEPPNRFTSPSPVGARRSRSDGHEPGRVRQAERYLWRREPAMSSSRPHRLVNPSHRLALGHEQQDGAVVDDDLHLALVVLDP